ncbi:MAG: T9SS C-terminal target domain-containing protein [Sphingobacteriales bacterium]|nr:MAG: T9SS C-terminal target domain-containing protein [Sphingobacteriales bacterium]
MKKSILFTYLLFITVTSFATDFYLRTGVTDPSSRTNWTQTASGGAGSSPTAGQFTGAGHNFYLNNTSGTPLTASVGAWTLNVDSRLILGNGTYNFTLTSTAALTASVEVMAGSTLTLNGTAANYVSLQFANTYSLTQTYGGGTINGSAITGLAFTNYYYDGSGPLNTLTNWTTFTDGTGSGTPANNPANFTTPGYIFNVSNSSGTVVPPTPAITADWSVTGLGARVVIGNGVTIIPSTATARSLNAIVGIAGTGILDLRGATANYTNLKLASPWTSLSATSTVIYNATATAQTLKGANYGNLTANIQFFNSITINSGTTTTNVGVAGVFSITGNSGDPNAIRMPGIASSTFIFNGSSAQTIPLVSKNDASQPGHYNNLVFAGSGVKTFGADIPTSKYVKIFGYLSVQGAGVNSTSPAPTYEGITTASYLEYNSTSNITVGPEWPAVLGSPDYQPTCSGGVFIGGTGSVTLNGDKQIGDNQNVSTLVPLTIRNGGNLITNNFKLNFHGNFYRLGTNTFNAGSSPIEIGGTNNDGLTAYQIAGFTTTGLVSVTKSNGEARILFTGRLPESGTGSFPFTINMAIPTSDADNTEVQFRRGVSSFHTTGKLTLTSGILLIHKALANNDLTIGDPTTVRVNTNPQICQVGDFEMSNSNPATQPAKLRLAPNVVSGSNNTSLQQTNACIFRVSGNFVKTNDGTIEVNNNPSLNGDIQFNGTTQTLDVGNYGNIYQMNFWVMSGSTCTLASTFLMNRLVTPYSDYEAFYVKSGGTLDFGNETNLITQGRFFAAEAGSTLIIRHPQGIYSGRNANAGIGLSASNPTNTMGCVRTASPEVNLAPPVYNDPLVNDGLGTHVSVTDFKPRYFSSQANYIFAGTGNQNTGLFETAVANPQVSVGDVIPRVVLNLGINKVSSTDVVNAERQFTVNGDFQQTNGIFKYELSGPTNPVFTLNGTASGTNGRLRGSSVCDLVLGNTGTGGTGNLGTLYFDQTTPGKSVGTGIADTLVNLSQGTTNVFRQFNVTRTNTTTATIGNYMQIFDIVTPTSGTIASGGNLVMLSTDASNSSILALGSGASITGNVVVQSFFKGGTVAANRGYRMIASPTNNTGTFFSQLKQRFIVTCAGGVGSGCDIAPTKQPTAQTLTNYIESGTPGASSFGPINHASTMEIGRGYYFFFRGSRANASALTASKINEPFAVPEDWTATHIGTINSGDITVPATKTTTSDAGNDGLNLVGNPYPAVLNFTTFRSDGSNSGIIDDYMMIMKRDRTGFVSYSGGVLSSGTLTSAESAGATPGTAAYPFIQPGQAFFVRKTALGTTNITFKEAHKATAANSKKSLRTLSIKNITNSENETDDGPVTYKPTAYPAIRQLIRFNIKSDVTQDDATIVLEEGNSANWGGNDAPYMANNTIYTYSLTADGVPAAINFMPVVGEVGEIKLFVEATKSDANLKLNFPELIGAGKNDVWLKDNYLQTNTLITATNSTYNFGIDKSIKATSGKDRFVLFFVPKIVYEVNLIDFTAITNNVGVQLNWETKKETNLSKFELQRSVDGVKFETINTQATKAEGGNSTQALTYNFLDKTAQIGTVYYRLKMVFKDESFTTSDVKTVNFSFNETNTVLIYPSQVEDELNVIWKAKNTENIGVSIYDVTGKMVKNYTKLKGNRYSTNVSHLNAGMYILKVKDELTNKLISVKKFIKL